MGKTSGSTPSQMVVALPVMARTALVIFVTEALIMVALPLFGLENHGRAAEIVIDALSLTVIASAILYFWQIKPLFAENARLLKSAELESRRFRDFAESTSDWLWEMDADLRFSYLSPKFSEHLEVRPDEIIGRRRWELSQADGESGEMQRHRAILEAHEDFRGFRYPFTNSDGRVIWFEVSGKPIFDEDGRFQGYRGAGHNITAQVEAEAELIKYKDRLERLVAERTAEVKKTAADLQAALVRENQHRQRLVDAINVVNEGFIIRDRHGRVVVANKKVRQIFPGSEQYLEPGSTLEDFLRSYFPEDSEKQIAARAKASLSASTEFFIDRKRNRYYRIWRAIGPCGDIIAFFNDVTRAIEKEWKLQRHARNLEKALAREKEVNELQRQFVSMASHEFRTPLTIIDGAAQQLQRHFGRLDAEATSKRVEKIRCAVKRMVMLMESMLAAARADAGSLLVNPEEFDLCRLIRECVDRQAEISPQYSIFCSLDDGPMMIRADRAALEQVFVNLLTNAVKYSPDSRRVDVAAHCVGDRAVITVGDSGIGIDEEDLSRIFDRFYRAKNSLGIAGTGIGLNLVKMLVEAHGGTVSVESRRGEGTVFTVTLPIGGMVAVEAEEGESLALSA